MAIFAPDERLPTSATLIYRQQLIIVQMSFQFPQLWQFSSLELSWSLWLISSYYAYKAIVLLAARLGDYIKENWKQMELS